MSSPTAFAFACLILATFFSSTAGVLLRWIEAADGWTVLFWRSLFFIATMGCWLLLRYRRGVLRLAKDFGAPELWVSLLFACATVAFVFALLETSVARVVLVNGLTPFVTALLGWALLGERIGGATWVAMAVAFCGIAVMMGSGLAGGSLLGDALAFATCLFTSLMYVTLRRRAAVDKVPALTLSGIAVALVALAAAPTLAISAHDLALCAALGCLQLAVQYILVSYATRTLPAAQVALTGRTSMVLAPLWAWLGAGEVPAEATFWGGALVLGAVLGNGLYALHRQARRQKLAAVPEETTP